jgi:hypothetical protein
MWNNLKKDASNRYRVVDQFVSKHRKLIDLLAQTTHNESIKQGIHQLKDLCINVHYVHDQEI